MTIDDFVEEGPLIGNLSDEELKNLIDNGYRYKHKSLEEYVTFSGRKLIGSEEIDFGPPAGEEDWNAEEVHSR